MNFIHTDAVMRRQSLWVAAGLVILAGCGSGDALDAHFKATWKHVTENGIVGTKSDETIVVIANGKKFRRVTRSAEAEITSVYDGATLYTKEVWVPSETAAATKIVPPAIRESARQVTEFDIASDRFWTRFLPVKREPGGLVAGQDTVLYTIAERRSDGELSEQSWVDAKTGILLKKIVADYSSQIRAIVTQNTWECQSIDYGPVDEAAFQKP
jgi:hypothetical protein